MPASKWLDFEKDIEWIKNDERIMNDMYLLPLLTKVNPKQEDENAKPEGGRRSSLQIT